LPLQEVKVYGLGDIHSQNVKGSFLSSLVLGPHPAAALPYTSEPSCESSKAWSGVKMANLKKRILLGSVSEKD
jgi:hypothetical protein